MGTDEVILYFEKYTPVGDNITMAVCIVFLILIYNSFINRTLDFFILQSIIYTLLVTAISDILFHMAMNHLDTLPLLLVYFLRFIERLPHRSF